MKIIGYSLLALLFLSTTASAKEFEIFDGQLYNGQFYPLVDIIEWGEQNKELPHIEFHFHSKEKPMNLSVVSGEKGGKPVLWIMYDLAFRNGEKICRHVPAPSHFREGMKLYTYRDNSDPDYDNIFVYSQPTKLTAGKKKTPVPEYTMPDYQRCIDENASNMPEPKGAALPVATAPLPGASRDPAATTVVAPSVNPPPREGKGLPIDYDNTAVPFSF